MVKSIKWLSLSLIMLLIGGCGGGGGGEDGDAQYYQPGINLKMSVSSTGVASTTIPSNDDAKVDIVFLDDGNMPIDNEIIALSATSGTLSQNSVLTDHTGRASITIYSPDIASGTAPGTLTASSSAYPSSATLNYQFAATTSDSGTNTSSAGSIQFIDASPDFMSLKGTGGVGYGETSQVTFKVVDKFGNPIEGANVNFNLSTTVGGLTLSPATASSNASGLVITTVQAGTISTPVRVGASVTLPDSELIYVQSDLLTVTTGIPDQNSFSLSFDKFAVEGREHDGETVTVTARLADRFNNPVPDGTVVNFTTEGGKIGDATASTASCQTQDSKCSVIWESQNPRPADGRASVLAWAIGHETFYDHNANGVFDDGDAFDDRGEIYRDDDESGTYNPDDNSYSLDEKLMDYDVNGVYTPEDGVYNGVPCDHSTQCPVDANNVAGRSNFLTNVGGSGIIIMASSFPNIHMYELNSGYTSCLDDNGKIDLVTRCQTISNFSAGLQVKNIWVMIEDSFAKCLDLSSNRIQNVEDPNSAACTIAVRQSAPTGASISVSSEVGTLSTIPYSAIPNQLAALQFSFTLTSADDNADPETGVIEAKVTLPVGGRDVYVQATVIDPAN